MSAPQAKEQILDLKRDSQESIPDWVLEIGPLVKQTYPYLPLAEQDLIIIEYLVHSLGSKPLQEHLLTTKTSTIERTAFPI